MPLKKIADSVIQTQENIIWSDPSKSSFRNNEDKNMQFYSRRLVQKVLQEMFIFPNDQIKAEISKD